MELWPKSCSWEGMTASKRGIATASIVAILAVGAVVFGLYSAGLPPFGPNGTGQLNAMVHDAPCGVENCTHVWVTFSSVSVHESGLNSSSFVNLNVASTVDLAQLNGSAMARSIGILTLKAGHYEQIRLTVANVTIELAGGLKMVAHVVSPTAYIDGQFNVTSGGTTTVSIDINLATSVHLTPGGLDATFTPSIGTVSVS